MERRDFLKYAALVAASHASQKLFATTKALQSKADFTLRIAPVSFEIAPGKTIHTIGYYGQVPGPLLRMKEGVPVMVDVFNDTDHEEIVHWHGQTIPVDADGAKKEGSPAVPPHTHRRYNFTPKPKGTRWYHSHAFAGKNLHRSLYSGQFGFVYIEPNNDPGRHDREVFLAMHQWEPYYSASMQESDEGSAPPPPNNGLEVGYRAFSFNDKALGHGEPIKVRQGERVLFHFLNSSATETVNVALPSHEFAVLALDGNPVPKPQKGRFYPSVPAYRIRRHGQYGEPHSYPRIERRSERGLSRQGHIAFRALATTEPRYRHVRPLDRQPPDRDGGFRIPGLCNAPAG